ncbi:MAG TPA: branched-chain amino acid ABC transporter permease [Clostridiales bacterium]|nr:branched-chain amino acid ABC transporter permease [Clostridiales bacterium]
MYLMQVLISGLMLGGIYAMVSMGLTMIFGVVRVINFAHGEFLMIAMYLVYWLNVLLGMDPYVSILITVPVFFVFGVFVQRILIQPIQESPATIKIFSTLGLGLVLSNLALMLWDADYRSVKVSYSTAVINISELSISVPRLIAFIFALLVAVFMYSFLTKTDLGKQIRAVSQNRQAALLMGINVRKIYMIAFGIGSALVGLAASLLMPMYFVYPSIGLLFGLIAFVVVVLGGLGNMYGAFLGGLIIGLVEAIAGAYIDPALKEVFYFIIFILILLLKPSGLISMGRGSEEVGL